MHWDRRFAIGVSLIWAALVSGAFYLLAGILPPVSPGPASGRQLRRELDRTNHELATPLTVSAAGVGLHTGADFAIIRPDPLYSYVRSPRGDLPCEARWFRPWQHALTLRAASVPGASWQDFPPTKCGLSPSFWELRSSRPPNSPHARGRNWENGSPNSRFPALMLAVRAPTSNIK